MQQLLERIALISGIAEQLWKRLSQLKTAVMKNLITGMFRFRKLSLFIGEIVPVKALITFEFMVRVSTPVFLFFCFLNAWRYYKFSYSIDLVLLGSWILLLCTMMAYWLYNKQGITKKLWAKGIWFSKNDVLHVFLIFWMIYIATAVADRIKDYTIDFTKP